MPWVTIWPPPGALILDPWEWQSDYLLPSRWSSTVVRTASEQLPVPNPGSSFSRLKFKYLHVPFFFFDILLLLKSIIHIYLQNSPHKMVSPLFLPKSSGERALNFCSLLLEYEEIWPRCHYKIHHWLNISLKIQNCTQDKILDSGDTKNVTVSILIKPLSKAGERALVTLALPHWWGVWRRGGALAIQEPETAGSRVTATRCQEKAESGD